MQPLIVLTRSNRIEGIHYGYVCVIDANNKVIYNIGDFNTKIYLRSTAKPFQAIPTVHSDVLEKYNITVEELAVICASHSGQDFHRKAVTSILKKIGLSEEHLGCGAANPYNQNALNNIIKKGERPSVLYNNCSGLHAGMLAVCKYYGFNVTDYTKPEHPVQKLILNVLAELLECNENDIPSGMDGCGLPTYMASLKQAAYLFSILAQGTNGKNKYAKSLGMIQHAMLFYPNMISGQKEFCTELISLSKGKAIGKIGAEGIYCVAVPEKQLGICIKILDGRERGIYPVIIHLLKQLGVLDDAAMLNLKSWAYPPIKNHKGELTGYTIPVFDINKPEDANNYSLGDKLEFKI